MSSFSSFAGSGNITVQQSGIKKSFRPTLNLIAGTGVTIDVTDDPTSNRANVTISSSGGGSMGWTDFGQSTPKQVNVTNTSTLLLDTNVSRLFASITNNSNQTIYIQYQNAAVYGQGLARVNPGTVYIIDTTQLFLGPIYAITSASSVDIDVIEGVSS